MYVCNLGKEMKGITYKNGIIIGIVALLLTTSITPISKGQTPIAIEQKNITTAAPSSTEQTSSISLTVFGKQSVEKQEILLSTADILRIYEKYQKLKKATCSNPFSEKTRRLQQEFVNLLEENQVIPEGMQKAQLLSLMQPTAIPPTHLRAGIAPFQNKAAEWMCTFVSEGSGAVLPILILPRFIPFLLTPIPRAFIRWNVKEGFTSCGGLRSGTGFIAYGEQKGIALGFWGIGLTFSLPPLMNMYGIIGYALYASVTADQIDHYPPNNPPEITQTDPADGEQLVPLTTSELRFAISDLDGDLMSYNVSTTPDIGSGSGGLKPDGIYTIPISELESLTTYTWHIQVTDGKDTTEKTCTFTTEPVAPVITNPVPADGERDVPMDTPNLRFTIKDYQGDAMEYTVQTSPNIGSAHATGVHDGTITVSIAGLIYGATYRWYVNATDGTYWTRKVFSFDTGYPSQFNPFEYGWQYRKQVTIDHTYVAGDLTNFPILISITDTDLIKAQNDGGDILFMNGGGAAAKLRHEIESFDGSSGTLAAWVNITSLSSSEDTVFYMYYGNPSCIPQEYPERTWDSHYKAVWHMNDATSTTIADSTSDGITGTKKAAMMPAQVSGKIGDGQQYNRTATRWDYIAMNDLNTLRFSGDFTLSAWIYPLSTQNMRVAGQHQDISANYKGYSLNWDLQGPGTKMSFRVDGGGYNYQYIYANEEKQPSNWYYMVGTKRSGTNYLYIDGTQQSQTGTQTLINSDYPFCIGAWRTDIASANFDGTIDEVRVSDIGRPSAWIQTEYNTMNNPTLFLTFGLEEPGP